MGLEWGRGVVPGHVMCSFRRGNYVVILWVIGSACSAKCLKTNQIFRRYELISYVNNHVLQCRRRSRVCEALAAYCVR